MALAGATALWALAGCAPRVLPPARVVTEEAMEQMPVHDALKVAVEELQVRGQMLRPEYKLTVSRVGPEWVFWFVFLPPTPGLDVTVFVSDDGQTRILPGL
jgi:hypothetical protein